MAARDDDDLPELRQKLADRAEVLFERLFDKPTGKRGAERRWGRKGSLVLYLRGRGGPHWHCYESDQGGDMLAAIRHARGLDFVGALEWARDWLGMPRRDGRRRKQRQDDPKSHRQDKAADYDAEQAEKARRAAELSTAAVPIVGTLAETYLLVHRGIGAESWPDALGFSDAKTVRRCTGWTWWRWPALVVRATDASGAVTGVQLVALHADGSAVKHWDHDGKLKLSFGRLSGSAVRLPGDDRALLLAEGPETALSCWWATGITTWCNLGSIAKSPLDGVPLDRLIVVCADDDPRNAPANKALRDAIRSWRRDGRRIVLVKPHVLTQRDKSDFNDTLRTEGRDAVRARILAAIEDSPEARHLLSVSEARLKTAELIDETIDELLNPSPFDRLATETQDAAPFKVLCLPTGIGKTEIAIRRIVTEAARGARIIYLVPTHKLGGELVERIEGEARRQGVNIAIGVWRGRNRKRPDDPDKTMCSELPTIAIAHAAKVDPAEVCKICPAAAECPYLAQQERAAQIWVGAHDLQWHAMPRPLKGADLVVVDEGFATRGLIGFDGKPRLVTEAELAAIPDTDRVSIEADIRTQLMPARRKLIAALRDHPAGGLRCDRLIVAGLTTEETRQARGFEWAAKHEVDITRMSWRRAKQAIDKAAERNLLIPRFAALWHVAEDLLADNRSPASGRAVIGDHKVNGPRCTAEGEEDFGYIAPTFRAVRLFGVEQVAAGWRRTPTLHIDATVDMTLLRCRVPHAELAGEVAAAAPHMRVIQYPDRAFGKLALRNQKFLFEVWDWCITYTAQRGGEWAVIVHQEAEVAILAAREVSDFIKLHHFGALRGLDELRNVRGLIVVGRPMASPGEVERIAGALSGREVEAVAGDWYPAEVIQLRARDGSKASVEADRHPDPLAEAVRASIAEGEVLQSIGRARGLNRTEADPVEVVLLSNVSVPGLPIDELRQWERPGINVEIFARFGAVLESAGDAAKIAGLTLRQVKDRRQRLDAFPYKRFLYENASNLVPHLCQAIYQLSGAGRARQRALFDRRRIADPEAWLTEWLGPLAYFGEVEPEQPAAARVADEQPVAATEAVEADPAAEPIDWNAILDAALPALPSRAPIPLGPLEPTEVGIAVGLRQPDFAEPIVRRCTWFVDTTGDVFDRCGEPITDGRDYCPMHRQRYADTLLGDPIRPPMPFGPFPTTRMAGAAA